MTERQWLRSTDPAKMLDCLNTLANGTLAEWLERGEPYEDRRNERKLRLFACACCRRVWHLLSDEKARAAVEAAEQYADGRIGKARLSAACNAAYHAVPQSSWTEEFAVQHASRWATAGALDDVLFYTPRAVAFGLPRLQGLKKADAKNVRQGEQAAQCALLRDIFGNPFRPVTADPAWMTPTVRKLARVIYDERTFDGLPVLADALEEAGCSDADVLSHCRGLEAHVRGCWVVDLLTAVP